MSKLIVFDLLREKIGCQAVRGHEPQSLSALMVLLVVKMKNCFLYKCCTFSIDLGGDLK